MQRRLLVPILGMVLGLVAAGSAAAIDVTTCGQTIPPHEVGVLQTDLSCFGAFVGVQLQPNATLQLNGHTIAGPYIQRAAVYCSLGAECTIVGPGQITGATFDDQSAGIGGLTNRVVVTDVDVTGNSVGIYFGRNERLDATDLRAHDNLHSGINVSRMVAERVEASHNGWYGIAIGHAVRGEHVTTDGNGRGGIFAGRVTLHDLTCRDNVGFGVRAAAVSLRDAVLDQHGGTDLISRVRPRLFSTTCGKSARADGGGSWGVCTND